MSCLHLIGEKIYGRKFEKSPKNTRIESVKALGNSMNQVESSWAIIAGQASNGPSVQVWTTTFHKNQKYSSRECQSK